jgi:hypothetical protein
MVNDQIIATMTLLFKIEQSLKEDINSQAFSTMKGENGKITEDSRKLLKQRRQSMGNVSIAHIHS